ncbi:hypothetical protein AB0I49_05100 [Streptomyces sp. NPDC050617]|uniref:hypothetical protein n=1 Tax=Streptomyces sp. NPDC050617 TaxID=3154628 RepID=UPI003448FEA9
MTSPGSIWLASCATSPKAVWRAWEAGRLALIASTVWTVVEAPLVPSLDAMNLLGPARRLGPAIAAPEENLVWWLVSLDAHEPIAELPELTVKPPGWGLLCPAPHRLSDGRCWLQKPDGSGRLTDPADLATAFASASASPGPERTSATGTTPDEAPAPAGGAFRASAGSVRIAQDRPYQHPQDRP